jgi:hypothetical protein
MRRFLSFFFLLLLLVVGVGFFRGWFSVSGNKEVLGEKLDVHFQVDPERIKQDANAVEEKTRALLKSP